MIQNETLKASLISILFILFSFSNGGCGQKSQNTAGLSISISPQQSFLLPGSSSNCLDVSVYKKAILTSGQTAPTEGTSVSTLRVSFPKFSLTWTPTSSTPPGQTPPAGLTLYVAYIRLIITSNNMSGGKFQYDIAGSELSALLGRTSNSFNGQDDLRFTDNSGNLSTTTGTINSFDPGRDCQPSGKNVFTNQNCTFVPQLYTAFFGACGVDIGGIALTNPNQTSQFTAPFLLKLVGYTVDSGGNQAPVFTQVNGTVVYSGVN